MNESHITKIITKLNRDTKEGVVIWDVNRSKPSSLSGSEFPLDNIYTAKVLDKSVRLYKFQSKDYMDEDQWEWLVGYRLEFIDAWGNSEWVVPSDRALYDLYETVRYKTSNIEDFLDKYLTDEDKEDKSVDPDF